MGVGSILCRPQSCQARALVGPWSQQAPQSSHTGHMQAILRRLYSLGHTGLRPWSLSHLEAASVRG